MTRQPQSRIDDAIVKLQHGGLKRNVDGELQFGANDGHACRVGRYGVTPVDENRRFGVREGRQHAVQPRAAGVAVKQRRRARGLLAEANHLPTLRCAPNDQHVVTFRALDEVLDARLRPLLGRAAESGLVLEVDQPRGQPAPKTTMCATAAQNSSAMDA